MIPLNNLFIDTKSSNQQLVLDQLNWTIKSIHTNIKLINKLNFYKLVLNRSIDETRGNSIRIYQDFPIECRETHPVISIQYPTKQSVLLELINTIEHLLIDEENIYYLDKYKNLETEISSYLDIEDLILQSISYAYISEHKTLLNTLRSWRRYVLQKHFKKIFRDLRLSFRCILKTLFKNLDDEDSRNNVYKINFLQTLFMNFNTHYHATTRNAFAFTKYTTYKC